MDVSFWYTKCHVKCVNGYFVFDTQNVIYSKLMHVEPYYMYVRSFIICSVSGSFAVVNSETLETIVCHSHRKQEVSDVKFSPS